MAKIQTYCRIKPSKRSQNDYDCSHDTLLLRVPEAYHNLTTQRNRASAINHEFSFTQVFSDKTSQEDVFDAVAKQIVENFLDGYNGTIFAYGQTGSGKTYTVEGSARRYKDRGLAPRSLSMIYQMLEGHQGEEYSVHVSYLEIYQETAYDLLNPAVTRQSTLVATFPKVHVIEGPKGSCIIRNLSSHLAASEDVAQSLLLQGQVNRKVAETPMNQRSSRSHAVFTIYLTAKKTGSDVISHAKLHLVDLAGSERASKSGIVGVQLAEAKFINLSLHHLEGVIIALNHQSEQLSRHRSRSAAGHHSRHAPYPKVMQAYRTRSKTLPSFVLSASRRPGSADSYKTIKHIPYRNSLLTMILRDSLGGNCLTAMIATISMECENLMETLSTCRFAQRVACIANNARKNEEIDDKSMIKRLRNRVAELETEIALLKHGQEGHQLPKVVNLTLTDEDKLECTRMVKRFLAGEMSDPNLADRISNDLDLPTIYFSSFIRNIS